MVAPLFLFRVIGISLFSLLLLDGLHVFESLGTKGPYYIDFGVGCHLTTLLNSSDYV
jgi:hypothetical protein